MYYPIIIGELVNVTPLIDNLDLTLKHIDNEHFKSEHKGDKSSFTRDRVFTIKNLIIFFLTQLQRSIKRELLDFIEAIRENRADLAGVSGAAFSKARKKLKYTAFVELNDVYVTNHYRLSENVLIWKDYRLFAVDGSTAEVPNSQEMINLWGVFKQREDGKKICMSRTIQVFDVLNKLTIKSDIDSINKSESELFWNILPQLANYPQLETHVDLYIFDRYYASHDLIFYLDSINKGFCFRMKKNWWKVSESFYNSGEKSRIVTLTLPAKYKQRADELGIIHRTIQVRLVRIELESGETEILLTSLLDEQNVTIEDLKELYGLRWPVETTYRHLKHKVKLENFSGKSENGIKQDFFVKIMILNIAVSVANPVDDLLRQQPKEKFTHQVNLTNAIGALKKGVVDWFIRGRVKESINSIIEFLLKTTEPIRKGRKFLRPKLPKTKYHRIYAQV
mgnify:CR=1 FL=1